MVVEMANSSCRAVMCGKVRMTVVRQISSLGFQLFFHSKSKERVAHVPAWQPSVLVTAMPFFLAILIFLAWKVPKKRLRYAPSIVGGVFTYWAYFLAVGLSGVPVVPFLRAHLYDALTPAAIVAAIIEYFNPMRHPRIMPSYFVGFKSTILGAATFAVVGFLAAFQANGPNGYSSAIAVCLFYGAIVGYFAYAAGYGFRDQYNQPSSAHDDARPSSTE